jgi:1-aminocyclopropane-1-carboxylate deaminase/D-cysteine desulfhydrase-like pyridoxal-dependent ACC family enzyme
MREFAINPTQLTEIVQHPGQKRGIRLFLKRDDLLHTTIQGNKWRKLHLLLEHLRAQQIEGILSFGGAFSNHLHALAAAGKEFGFHTLGILRGSSLDLENPTLQFAQSCGMQLIPVPKKVYDQGLEAPEVQAIIQQYPHYYVLPEGGATRLGVLGCVGIGQEILNEMQELRTTHVCVPAGTGSTAAGTLAGMGGKGQLWVFPAARYGVDAAKIRELCTLADLPVYENFDLITDYHFNGFANMPDDLRVFVPDFQQHTGILLDPIYTAKMMYGIFDLLEKDFFAPNTQVVALHTGGLQGWDGFRYRFGLEVIGL